MEGQLFHHTEMGVPQGGILSPLLSNLYLHQFDQWWWSKYGSLTRNERRQRRRRGLGHPILIRYADDWLLLWNGGKEGAIQLKEEAKAFLEQDLHLELSESKTRVTHVDDGFTFLGFHICRYKGAHRKAVVLIRPSPENVRKLKAKIKALTRSNTSPQPVWYKVQQLNQILRGWSAYYQHVNAKAAFSKLDWWVLNRIFRWARKKHGRPPWRVIRAKYRHQDSQGRINFVCHLIDGSPIELYRMSDRPIRRYWVNWQRPTYATEGIHTDMEQAPEILVEPVSYPAKESDQLRLIARRRDGYTCQQCQATRVSLNAHHIRPQRDKGPDALDNLTTLCIQCHRKVHKTPLNRRAEPTVKAEREPCAGKLASTVREAARGKHGSGCAPPC